MLTLTSPFRRSSKSYVISVNDLSLTVIFAIFQLQSDTSVLLSACSTSTRVMAAACRLVVHVD